MSSSMTIVAASATRQATPIAGGASWPNLVVSAPPDPSRALLAEAFRIPSGLFAWQHRLEIRDSRFGPPVAASSLHEWGPLVVPADTYFMMGDNRDDSVDSRYYGPVPRANLRGTPTFVYYSY